MAKFINTKTQETVILRNTHVFGRSASAVNTQIGQANASRVHASIVWQGIGWYLQDKSTNGTYLNNVRVTKEQNTRLQSGDLLQFGSIHSTTWKLLSEEPPSSLLVQKDAPTTTLELTDMLVLPDENSPEVTFYQDEWRNWVCETQFETRILQDGESLTVAGKAWIFVSNVSEGETYYDDSQAQESELSLIFKVSQNEEHISLEVNYGSHQFNLGNKSYHYLLLLLARHWLAEKQKNIPDIDCGWLDKTVLCKELRTQEQYMNIQIYRHRKQLSSSLPDGLIMPPTIERRLREVRLNCHTVHIEGGNPYS